MTNEVEQNELQDVLDAYVADVQEPSREKLMEWVRRYPQFEQALFALTVDWIEMRALSPAAKENVDEDALVLRGMSVIQNLLHQDHQHSSQRPETGTAIKGLLQEGGSQGLTPRQLADRVDLSGGLLRKLDLRYILYATIPLKLIEAIADAIRREVLSVAQYLKGEPILPRAASYKARQAPVVPEQRSFFDEVREDQELDEERRKRWLDLEPRKQ